MSTWSCADLDEFVRLRPRLLAIARRIAGNADDADDILQDVWLRWQRTDRATVLNAEAFLATVTGRLAINLIQSARRRHESYVAPDQHVETADREAGPHAEAERREAIESAVRLVADRLPPTERAAYVLREGFEYPYARIAELLRTSPANARQLVTRARSRVTVAGRRPYESPAHSFLQAFSTASRRGDLAGLEQILSSAGRSTAPRVGAGTARQRPPI
ncbi:sigma-70 family RNA polymerase sigma factor [Actinoplanes sp. NPDC051513]|uniref:sigma-70 family RNA polymerase sigma factor n=1 Tax=Actinoplanes sp. NPDC051513 TaxID=3363908 RepID=UPI0037A5FE0B